MKKPNPDGPACPGCGYAIFGLRDMKCPECGRALDVRDFNLDGAANRGESRRYERHAALGGVIGIVVLVGLFGGLIAIVRYFMQFHVIPAIFLVGIAVVAITLIGVLGQTGQSIWSLFKNKK